MNQTESGTKDKKPSLFINDTPIIVGQPFEPTIIIGKHKVDVQTLEKLIEFAQSGKLDEIMSSED
ncbi:hypothetical protein ABRY77_16270 [Enterococcus casseliflavus]|uniref:hypothetical protein n=1 Tax=Enterococcus casseliflavus TaxID=37734 RepID=UPI003EE3E068